MFWNQIIMWKISNNTFKFYFSYWYGYGHWYLRGSWVAVRLNFGVFLKGNCNLGVGGCSAESWLRNSAVGCALRELPLLVGLLSSSSPRFSPAPPLSTTSTNQILYSSSLFSSFCFVHIHVDWPFNDCSLSEI